MTFRSCASAGSWPRHEYTTIEFDAPHDEMIATYLQFLKRGGLGQ